MAASRPGAPHLLVVEADAEVQHIFQRVLAEAGYAITLASSLEEALRLLEQQPCDLVLTDTFALTRQRVLTSLRPLLILSHRLPILVCTAWSGGPLTWSTW